MKCAVIQQKANRLVAWFAVALLGLVVSGSMTSLLTNRAESLFFGWWAAWIFSEWSRLPALAGIRWRTSAPPITELA